MTGDEAPVLLTHNLDSCSVLVKVGQLGHGEGFTVPQDLLDEHQLTVVTSNNGIVIKGERNQSIDSPYLAYSQWAVKTL